MLKVSKKILCGVLFVVGVSLLLKLAERAACRWFFGGITPASFGY